MVHTNRLTRRQFLKTAVGGAAAVTAAIALPYVITSRALGGDGKAAASNRVALGCIGIGNMGGGHLGSFVGGQIVVILPRLWCNDDRKSHSGDNIAISWLSVNVYPAGQRPACPARASRVRTGLWLAVFWFFPVRLSEYDGPHSITVAFGCQQFRPDLAWRHGESLSFVASLVASFVDKARDKARDKV